MTSSGRDVAAGLAAAGPLPPAPGALVRIDDALVVDVLARLAAADGTADVAAAALPLLLEVVGVRGAAVVARHGSDAVVLGSAGYDCSVMATGTRLPMDAGLPVTEALRTGKPVVQGNGPSWVAVPFARDGGRPGALLISLDTDPPRTAPELARLGRLVRALGDALDRAGGRERAAADLAVVTSRLASSVDPVPGWDVVVRVQPLDGPVGGDGVLCLPDGRGGHWLLAADVCGSGLPAAVVAQSVAATFRALAPYVTGAASLLDAADRALRPVIGEDCFVTAVAVHAVEGWLDVASAGHPEPLLLTPAGPVPVRLEPGAPLALDSDRVGPHRSVAVHLPDDAVLLLHTDGLADRRSATGPRTADVAGLVAGTALDDLDRLADELLARVAALGPAGDDASLLLARPSR